MSRASNWHSFKACEIVEHPLRPQQVLQVTHDHYYILNETQGKSTTNSTTITITTTLFKFLLFNQSIVSRYARWVGQVGRLGGWVYQVGRILMFVSYISRS